MRCILSIENPGRREKFPPSPVSARYLLYQLISGFIRLLHLRLCGLAAFFGLRQATTAAMTLFFTGHLYHLLSMIELVYCDYIHCCHHLNGYRFILLSN